MIEYRGYRIETDTLCGYVFAHEDYDGAPDSNDGRCGSYDTLRECLDWIDDYIADDLFCESCGHTGKIQTEFAFDECEHCETARKRQGNNVNYPDTCPECGSAMQENFPGSGKENMSCFACSGKVKFYTSRSNSHA